MTLRKVRYATSAHEDYAALIEYVLARSGREAALAVDALLERAIASLERFDHGRVVPELRDRGYEGYREVIAAPYRIVYQVTRREVWILAIVDSRRDLDELLHERVRRAPLDKILT